jgi:mRNA-degrading endonuclease RelE of RelBE toxin-antitoxin system
MQTVAETPTFTRQAEKLFDEEEKLELIAFLAGNPLAGDLIPDTGGVRKVRFAASGRGKRGGARVIYYFLDDSTPLYALLVYPKSEKAGLTAADKQAASALVEAIKAARKKK